MLLLESRYNLVFSVTYYVFFLLLLTPPLPVFFVFRL